MIFRSADPPTPEIEQLVSTFDFNNNAGFMFFQNKLYLQETDRKKNSQMV